MTMNTERKRVGGREGVTFEIKLYPYPRVLEYLKHGELDLAIIFRNQSVKGHVTYVGRVSLSKVIIISGKGKAIHQYEDLYNIRRVAVIRKVNFESRFDRDSRINKYSVLDYYQSVQLLERGRVDAAVGSQFGLQYAIDTLGINTDGWKQPYVLGHKEWWVHFSRKSKYRDLVPAM